jgi:Flp pilus assembly protein TadG
MGRLVRIMGRAAPDLLRTRRAAVAVMFAAAAIPMLGLVGVAVDYAVWNEANSGLQLAANVAALTAVKIAANAQLAATPAAQAQAQGQNAGAQWFIAQVGSMTQTVVAAVPVTLTGGYPYNSGPNVQVTMGATVTATVTYNGAVSSVFGSLFGVHAYPISGQAAASVASDPYLNVEMLLDNSSSMDIGATVQDMTTLMALSACDPSNYVPSGQPWGQSYQAYSVFAYSDGGRLYDGTISTNGFTGVDITSNPVSYNPEVLAAQSLPPNGQSGVGPSCDPLLPSNLKGQGITAGPPCAFACHWDGSSSSGAANDLYGMARRTIGTAYQVTLRFDLVKNATQQVLQTMQADDEAIRNLKVGIFTFNSSLQQVYPSSGEAGDAWGTAETDVGLPPTSPTATETGIQPVVGLRSSTPGVNNGNNYDTAFPEAMQSLQNQYLTTAAGDGTTAAAPRKVLFIITDGFLDDPWTTTRSAFPPSACDGFKNLGYTIYVVYTPYYPVMHTAYLLNDWSVLVSGTGSTSISYNLQECASSGSDYISATSQSDLNNALQLFLRSALNQPARFVM